MTTDIPALLWKMSLQTAIVAAVVWIVCRLARKAPASWRCALWLLVIVKLFVPPFAYLPAQLAFWQHAEPAVTQPLASSEGTSPVAFAPAQSTPSMPAVSPPSTEQPAASAPIAASEVLAYIWLVGFVAMTTLTVLRFVLQTRLVSGSASASSELAAMLCECAQRLGVRRLPRLRLSRAARTPMLLGALRPTILLPSEILGSCTESNLRAMLLHELAHVKRRDMAVLLFQQLAQALFFFHPAVWLAGHEMRRERELACDELVLSCAGIAPKDYAAGYISALKLANGRPAVATSLAMAEPFDLEKRRLQGILERPIPKLSPPSLIVLFALIALSLPTFVGCSKPEAANPSSAEPDARVMAGLTPIAGPGLIVTLHDSAKSLVAKPEVAAEYIVHDRDIREVVNELWAAGAKAISINGQRFVANSSIRCVGPDIRINSVPVPAPFVIRAVGDPAPLNRALTLPGGPAEGLTLLDMIDIKQQSQVEVPAYGGPVTMHESQPQPPVEAPADNSPKVSARDLYRASHLPWAITDSPEQAMDLIRNGANVNATDEDGRTALHLAVFGDHYAIAKLLLEHGAKVNVKEHSSDGGFNGWGWYPLHLALRNENKEMIRLLISYGADVNVPRTDKWVPLHTAACHGQPDMVELLIAHGAKVDTPDFEHCTPLRIAIDYGKVDAAIVLIRHGANVNTATTSGRTPLHSAASSGDLDAIRLLLAHRAKVNARSKDQETPLGSAARHGRADAARFLIGNRAIVDAKSDGGKTPLYEAAYRGFADTVKLLIASGANVNARTKTGVSPLQAAANGQKAYNAGKRQDFDQADQAAHNWDEVRRLLSQHSAKS